MSYVREVVGADEKILYQAKISLWIFTGAFLALPILLVVLAIAHKAGSPMEIWYILFVLILVFARVGIIYFGTELALTDHRLIYKTGIISRYTNEMNYSRVESIQISQDILGRIFNYGTIRIRGVGTDGMIVRGMDNPIAFRKAFSEASGKN